MSNVNKYKLLAEQCLEQSLDKPTALSRLQPITIEQYAGQAWLAPRR